jgi:hypothetical protein
LLPFPGSLLFWGQQAYIRLQEKLSETILPTITEYNIHGIPDLIRLTQSFNCLLMVRPEFGYFYGNRSLPIELARRIRDWLKEQNVWTNEACLKAHIDGGNRVERPRCRSVTAAIVVSPDNKAAVVLRGLWKKLPLWFTNAVGPRVIRYYIAL